MAMERSPEAAFCDAGEPETAAKRAALAYVKRFAGDESGITAIEYALIAGLITLGIVTSVRLIGTTLSSTYYGPLLAGF